MADPQITFHIDLSERMGGTHPVIIRVVKGTESRAFSLSAHDARLLAEDLLRHANYADAWAEWRRGPGCN